MDFDLIIKLWPMVTGIFGAIGAVAVLFYRVTANENAVREMSTADRIDHAALGAKFDTLTNTVAALKLDVATDYVHKQDFNRVLSRIEDKLDTLNDTLVKALVK
jgi:hypothetical protein